jgi:hypothetical protein
VYVVGTVLRCVGSAFLVALFVVGFADAEEVLDNDRPATQA